MDLSNFFSKLHFSQTNWKPQTDLSKVLSSLNLEPFIKQSDASPNQVIRMGKKSGSSELDDNFFLQLPNFLTI